MSLTNHKYTNLTISILRFSNFMQLLTIKIVLYCIKPNLKTLKNELKDENTF